MKVAEAGVCCLMSTLGWKLLVVEDDIPLGKFLSRELGRKDFEVTVAADGKLACAQMDSVAYDLCLMDLNLPDLDGRDLLKRVRSIHPDVPVMILSGRNRTQDLVQALEDGADDFLSKPFSFQELVARLRCLLRRNASPQPPRGLRIPDLTVIPEEYAVFRGQRRIELTPREFGILQYLMNNLGRVVSRQMLMEEVWHTPYDTSTNIVDVYMKYLRDKIDGGEERKLICTVRGVGYRLRYEEQ